MKVLIVLALAIALAIVSARPGFPEGRIINGQAAKKGDAPYIVSLKTSSHFCAGSLIAPNWVITAAHCLMYQSFSVVAGLYKRNDESDVQIREVTNSSQYTQHEKYGGGVGPNDIGIIYIAKAFDLNALSRNGTAAVGSVSLPSGKYSQTGKGKLYGWGRDNAGLIPNTLNYLDVNIIGYTECKALLPTNAPIDASNICTYTANTTDGPCHRDSGGPLIIQTPEGVEQVGIVSWGYTPCVTTKSPSMYTAVSSHLKWIEQKMDSINANKQSF